MIYFNMEMVSSGIDAVKRTLLKKIGDGYKIH